MASVEGGAVIIDMDWPGLKNQINTRNLSFRFEENSSAYEIFAVDGPYFYKTIIYKLGQAPQDQLTYDSYRTEFESSYKTRITDFNATEPFFLTNVDGYSVVLKDGGTSTSNDGYGIGAIGYDGSNYRLLKTNSSGVLRIDPVGTTIQPISGTVTANQGTSPWVTNITQIGSTNISTGTGASGAGIPRVTVSNDSNILATQSGTWTVQPGNTANTTPWLATINQGGNSATVTGANALKVDGSAVTQPVSGTVTANIGTTGGIVLDTTLAAQSLVDNAVFTDGTTRVVTSGHIFDEVAGTALTENDVGASRIDAKRAQVFVIEDSVTRGLRATIKAASTVPVAADTALVVSLSPNSTGASVTNPSIGSNNSAIPTSSTQVGGSDGTNLQVLRVFDLDSSGGTQYVLGVGLRKSSSGGSIELGTSSDPIRIDPTGTTTQPVSSTQLPASLVGGRLDENIGAWMGSTAPTVGQKTMANSIPTVIALDQSKIPVHGPTATGTAPTGYPVTIGGTDQDGYTQFIELAADKSQLVSAAPNRQVISANATITSSYSRIIDSYGSREISLFINIKNSPTGTTPTITYTLQEVDPGDYTTTVGTTVTGAALNAIGTQILTLPVTKSGVVKISWTIAGTNTPSFTGVYATVTTKIASSATLYDANGNAIGPSNPLSINFGNPTGAAISFGDIQLNSITTAAVFRTTYTEQTTNFTGSILSSSVNDTAAGTGAQQVTIEYVDQTGTTRNTTTYTLNGTTPVNLSATGMCFIESIIVTRVGSGGVNAGTITLKTGAAGAGTTVGTIAVGDNTTFWAHHYTLSGKTCKITGTLLGSTSTTVGAGCIAFIKAQNLNTVGAPEVQVTDTLTLYGQSSMTPRVYTTAIPIASGPARLRFYVTTISSTTQTYRTSFDFIDE